MAANYDDRLRLRLFFLEDPKYPSLGPHLYLLGFSGLWHPSSSKTSKYKQILFYVSVVFFLSQYVKCLIFRESESVKLLLQYAPFHMGMVKACFFQKYHNYWEELISYSAATERKQLDKQDQAISNTINSYISRNRRVTYFFWVMAFFTNCSIFSEPYLKSELTLNGTSTYPIIFDGVTPFSQEPPGYYFSMLIQTVLGLNVSSYVISWDTLVVSLMIFYAGQSKVARIYCRRLIDAANRDRSQQNIAEFHQYYVTLVKYQKLFGSLVSPVMFFYLIVVSINLGVSIINLVELQDQLATLVSSLIFVVACLIQLFIFYWHSNEVSEESNLVSYAVYESDWVGTDIALQKDMLLLCLTTTKRMVFKAGPFSDISLATFVGILKTSYSFYALLHGTNYT